jgi:hypothetical protein
MIHARLDSQRKQTANRLLWLACTHVDLPLDVMYAPPNRQTRVCVFACVSGAILNGSRQSFQHVLILANTVDPVVFKKMFADKSIRICRISQWKEAGDYFRN